MQSLTGGQDRCVLSRIVLPDGSSTVVRMHRGETVGATLTPLLHKRSLNYSAVDVFVAGSDKVRTQQDRVCGGLAIPFPAL